MSAGRWRGAFEGRTVIITGAALGIGRALAIALGAAGARLVLLDRRAAELEAVAASLASSGASARAVVLDVKDAGAVHAAVRAAHAELGRIDYLFNNAGVAILAEALAHTPEHWQEVIETNLMGAVHGIQAAYPIMVGQRSGHIVSTASLAGLIPVPVNLAYVASKFGLVGLSHALRLEGEPLGIKVSVVCPASVATELTRHALVVGLDPARLSEVVPDKPMSAERCAQAILEGVVKNRATITPGLAGWLALIHRLFPFATRKMAESMHAKVDQVRLQPGTTPGSAGR